MSTEPQVSKIGLKQHEQRYLCKGQPRSARFYVASDADEAIVQVYFEKSELELMKDDMLFLARRTHWGEGFAWTWTNETGHGATFESEIVTHREAKVIEMTLDLMWG